MIEEGINLLTTDLLMTLLIQNQKNRFRKILCCLFVKLFLDDPEIQKLSSIFVFMDLNEDGEITTEELQYFVQALLKQKISADELRQVCRSVSIEERDRITFLEFLVACASKEFFSNKSYRRIIFDRVDYEGEGFINSSKLMTCMDRLGVKYNPKNLEKAVKEYDMYKDGKITFYLFNTMFDKVDFPSSKQNDQDKFENFYGKLNKHYQDLGN